MKLQEKFNIITTKTIDYVTEASLLEYPNLDIFYGMGLWLCPERIVNKTEAEIGMKFPNELRQFYIEIGVGRLPNYTHTPYNSPNNILVPSHIPKLMDRTCEWLPPDVQVEPNTIPFFERDRGLFICVHPLSENPNAVYWMWGEKFPNGGKISDSVVEFFKKLLDDPDWFNR